MARPIVSALARAASERDVQQAVEEALCLGGWLWHWCGDSRKCTGSSGLPDLVAVHPRTGRVVWIECKSAKGKLAGDQQEWRDALRRGGAEHYVVRHGDMGGVVDMLVAERRRARQAATPTSRRLQAEVAEREGIDL